MAKVGRKPYEFTPKRIKQVKTLAEQGLNEKQICAQMGISQETYFKNKRKNTELTEAYIIGKELSIGKIVNSMHVNANEKMHFGAQSFLAVNLDPDNWQHINRTEHTGKGGGPLQVEDVTKLPDQEIEQRVRLLLENLSPQLLIADGEA